MTLIVGVEDDPIVNGIPNAPTGHARSILVAAEPKPQTGCLIGGGHALNVEVGKPLVGILYIFIWEKIGGVPLNGNFDAVNSSLPARIK
jgi:hypothetical protein